LSVHPRIPRGDWHDSPRLSTGSAHSARPPIVAPWPEPEPHRAGPGFCRPKPFPEGLQTASRRHAWPLSTLGRLRPRNFLQYAILLAQQNCLVLTRGNMANTWQLFAVVAGAHFLALLSPGPDFFLIIRSALLHGW